MHFHCSCSCFTAFKTKATPSWCVLESSRRFSWENQQRDRRGREKNLKPLAWGSGDRHSLTIMLWHAVTLHKLAEGVTFRRCVLFSPTWTHVEEHSWDATIWYHLRETSVEMGEEQQFTSVYGLKHVVSKHAGKLHLPIPNAPLYKKPYHNFPFPSFPLLLEVSLSTTVISTFQIFSTSL